MKRLIMKLMFGCSMLMAGRASADDRPVVVIMPKNDKVLDFIDRVANASVKYAFIVPVNQVVATVKELQAKSYKSRYDEARQIELGKELAANVLLLISIKGDDITLQSYDLKLNAMTWAVSGPKHELEELVSALWEKRELTKESLSILQWKKEKKEHIKCMPNVRVGDNIDAVSEKLGPPTSVKRNFNDVYDANALVIRFDNYYDGTEFYNCTIHTNYLRKITGIYHCIPTCDSNPWTR